LRQGLQVFASEDIPAGKELTVDYETYNDFGKRPDYIGYDAGGSE